MEGWPPSLRRQAELLRQALRLGHLLSHERSGAHRLRRRPCARNPRKRAPDLRLELSHRETLDRSCFIARRLPCRRESARPRRCYRHILEHGPARLFTGMKDSPAPAPARSIRATSLPPKIRCYPRPRSRCTGDVIAFEIEGEPRLARWQLSE